MSPFVNIHTHHYIDNKDLIQIVNIDIDNLNVDVSYFHSVGIHPWESLRSTDYSLQTLSTLSQILSFSNSQFLKAIGECGIDRACDIDIEIQKSIFIKQIEIAERHQKPLIIHCVRAYPDIISIRKETKATMPWIFHGFQGNEQTAMQLLRHNGVYISLGDVLFKNEARARRLLEIIPYERLFFETDVAERNIVEIYEKASLLSGTEIETLRNDIFNNFVKIFGDI